MNHVKRFGIEFLLTCIWLNYILIEASRMKYKKLTFKIELAFASRFLLKAQESVCFFCVVLFTFLLT